MPLPKPSRALVELGMQQRLSVYLYERVVPADSLDGVGVVTEQRILSNVKCSLQRVRLKSKFGFSLDSTNFDDVASPTFICSCYFQNLPNVPYAEVQVSVDGKRYKLLKPPINVAGQSTLLEFELGGEINGSVA